jgi:hypothetical protein
LHVKTNNTQTLRTKADGMSDVVAQEMMLHIAEMDEQLAKRAEAFSGVEPDALAVACGQAIEQLWQPCHVCCSRRWQPPKKNAGYPLGCPRPALIEIGDQRRQPVLSRDLDKAERFGDRALSWETAGSDPNLNVSSDRSLAFAYQPFAEGGAPRRPVGPLPALDQAQVAQTLSNLGGH